MAGYRPNQPGRVAQELHRADQRHRDARVVLDQPARAARVVLLHRVVLDQPGHAGRADQPGRVVRRHRVVHLQVERHPIEVPIQLQQRCRQIHRRIAHLNLIDIKQMKLESIHHATDGKHKYVAVFVDSNGRTKTTKFGAHGMDDYTLTKDTAQRSRYRQRHEKDLGTKNPTKAGFLSYYILWGPSTSIQENIHSYKRKFNL